MYGACNGNGALGRAQISLNFNYKVNFKDFYTKLCVSFHKKDTKHIRWDFILSPGSCPTGGTLGCWGGQVIKKLFFQTWSCGISNQRG